MWRHSQLNTMLPASVSAGLTGLKPVNWPAAAQQMQRRQRCCVWCGVVAAQVRACGAHCSAGSGVCGSAGAGVRHALQRRQQQAQQQAGMQDGNWLERNVRAGSVQQMHARMHAHTHARTRGKARRGNARACAHEQVACSAVERPTTHANNALACAHTQHSQHHAPQQLRQRTTTLTCGRVSS